MQPLTLAPARDSAPVPARHPGVDNARLVGVRGTAALQAEAFRGQIDAFSPTEGVRGWLIDLRDPGARFELELVLGDQVHPCEVHWLHRPDIWATDDVCVAPGFTVQPESLLALAGAELDPETTVGLRLAGQDLFLQTQAARPQLQELRRWAEDRMGGSHPTEALPLPLALDRHHRVAQSAQRGPLRAAESRFLGYIERVVHIDSQHTVLFGWTRQPVQREQAAVMVHGGRRSASALVLVPFARDDLPAGAQAFVALLHGGWRASGPQDQSFLFLLQEDGGWLRTHQPLTLESLSSLRPTLQDLMSRLHERRLDEIQRLLDRSDRWAPSAERAQSAGVQFWLDQVLLLPGFGALVDGWILAAGAQLEQLQLRVGDSMLVLDPATLQTRARPDLAEPFPQHRDRTGQAGFSAVLRGPLAASDWDKPAVCVGLDDGLELTLPLQATQLRRIDTRFDFDRLERPFPAIEHEPWLDDFGRALREQLVQGVGGRAQVLERVRAERMLWLALPTDPATMGLVLSGLLEHGARLPAGVGVTLLCDPGHDRARLLRWCAAIRARWAHRRLGLVLLPDVQAAFYALPRLRHPQGVQHFTFLGPQAVLSDEGWALLSDPWHWQTPGVQALSCTHIALGLPRQRGEAQAFSAEVTAFEAQFRRLPGMAGGFHGRNGLQMDPAPPGHHAWRLAGARETGVAARLNQALLRRVEPA